ncbi:MAG: aspartate kinase [Bacteroidales bacterium]
MKTIAQITDELISESPYLEEALMDNLINISSLARMFKPDIEKRLGRKVHSQAIMMAIKRRPSGLSIRISRDIRNFMHKLGDIIVRSDLIDYTFENSPGLNACNRHLIDGIAREQDVFCTISQGVYETTLVVSDSLSERIETVYKQEKLIAHKSRLSSVTLRLPASNTEISGIYYFLLKNLGWAGINVCEIISTSNEVTFVVDEKDVHKAFSVLMDKKYV